MDVGSVYPPKPIRVIIDNIDNDNDFTYTSTKSFVQDFNLPNGRYVITIFGMNQVDDTTTASVSGAIDPHNSQSSDRSNYVFVFIGDV
ncbi:MAG: hypothetical protein V4581_05345 [Bacteroidota bacterium]